MPDTRRNVLVTDSCLILGSVQCGIDRPARVPSADFVEKAPHLREQVDQLKATSDALDTVYGFSN